MHAAVDSAVVEVGETPRMKNPPEANLLVKYVGFFGRGRVEMRRELGRSPSSNKLEALRLTRMRPKSGFAVSHIWVYSRRPRLADMFLITSWSLSRKREREATIGKKE